MPSAISLHIGHAAPTQVSKSVPPFRYCVYGLSLRSDMPLSLPENSVCELAQIVIRCGTSAALAEATAGAELHSRSDWYSYAHLQDGSTYVRWNGMGEFLVRAGGQEIHCVREPGVSMESFQVYLLGQALSFALVKRGFEPLHGTAIVAEGEAIVLLGDSGFGKSTLAASFIDAGYTLLTDDLLLLRPVEGRLDAYPGPPRIKLYPEMAQQILGSTARGVPMNAETQKLVIPLDLARSCFAPVRLRAIYVLSPPHKMLEQQQVCIEALPAREAFIALVSNTFNDVIADSSRLQRQVVETTRFLNAVPVRRLSYPRSLARLPEVRAAILDDSRGFYGRRA